MYRVIEETFHPNTCDVCRVKIPEGRIFCNKHADRYVDIEDMGWFDGTFNQKTLKIIEDEQQRRRLEELLRDEERRTKG